MIDKFRTILIGGEAARKAVLTPPVRLKSVCRGFFVLNLGNGKVFDFD